MKKNADIFDLEHISDLPESIKEIINKRRRSVAQTRYDLILDLFDLAEGGILTRTQILVGTFRKYKLTLKSHTLNSTLQTMVVSGLLERVSRGHFAKTGK